MNEARPTPCRILLLLISDQSVDAIGLNTAAIHALQTLSGVGVLARQSGDAADAAVIALKHPSAGVRRNAVQVIAPSGQTAALLESGVIVDRDPQVRLAALLALADQPAGEATAQAAIDALGDRAVQQDRHLLDAATAAAAQNGPLALASASKSSNKALCVTAATERLSIVAGHVARSGLEHPVPLLARLKTAQPDVAVAILSGLARNWPRDVKPMLSAELEASLGELFATLPAAGKSQLVTLATRWGSEGLGKHVATLTTSFLKEAANTEASDQARLKAAKEYADLLRADAAAAKLLDLVTPQTSPEIAQGLIEALGPCETDEVGQALADRLPEFTPAVRRVALRVLLARNDWTGQLLEAIESGNVPLADLSLDQKQALASHPTRRIAARARGYLRPAVDSRMPTGKKCSMSSNI